MNLSHWKSYVAPTDTSILLDTLPVPEDTRIYITGEEGHFYLLPQKIANEKDVFKTYGGSTSGCLWTCFHKQCFSELSEIRIYCMMSQKDVRKKGVCYVAALRGDKRVSLLKYTEGLRTSPEILVTLRLPAEYKHGMFGLLWAYNPTIRSGVFFRCMLRIHPSLKSFRLFEYIDSNIPPLVFSKGEGIGMSSFDKTQKTQVSYAHTVFRTLLLTDPKEDSLNDDTITI